MASVRALTADDVANPRPVYVVWELTLRCDQACRHCGSRAGVARRDELTADEALDLVGQMAAIGVREVTLIGGESYLRDDWLAIIAAITAAGMRCSLVTGGRGLTPDRAMAAAHAGATSVSVSIDGLGPTHDALRAVPGSYDGALRALDAVRAAGAVPTVNTQINQRNRAELAALGEVLVAHGVRAWQLQLTTPMGRAADVAELVLQPWQLLDVVPDVARLKGALAPRGLDVMATNNLGYFGPHEGDVRAGGHWIGCTGGRWSLGVQSDGTIKGCSSLPAGPYGDQNVRDASLGAIVAGSPALAAMRDRTSADLWGFCASCYYADVCLGGCVWTAHTLLGKPGNMPWCHHRAIELKARGRRERLVAVGAAPGRPFDRGEWTLIEEDWVDEPG